MIRGLVIQKLTVAGKEYEYPDTTALVEKINELVDAVNGILDYAPLEMAQKAEKPNIDIGELAYLQKENTELKDELERTHKALDKAKWWLHEIVESHRFTPISTAEMALKEITALEQKDK